MRQNRNLEDPCLVSALLVLAVLAVYLPVIGLNFLTFDDDCYVTRNLQVAGGLTWAGLRWAFTHAHCANWHPLTWLSHMLDCQLYGLNPAGHHLTNLLFHATNAVLLFLWLRSLTAAFWRSAFVAALFALHPLHVESVAWVAERKDVLCSFFGLLSLWAYTRYAKQSRVQSRESKVGGLKSAGRGQRSQAGRSKPESQRPSTLFYVLSLLLFALGLMSKPMLVTWPCVMLLLDYWPLGRSAECGAASGEEGQKGARQAQLRRWTGLAVEKILSSPCPPRRVSSRSWRKRQAARWSRCRSCHLGRGCSMPWTATFATAGICSGPPIWPSSIHSLAGPLPKRRWLGCS